MKLIEQKKIYEKRMYITRNQQLPAHQLLSYTLGGKINF